jgi:hypothetical protein
LGFAAAEWDVEAAVVGLETPLPQASFFVGGTIASTLSKADGLSFHFHTVRAAGTITPKTLGLGGPCWWEVSRGGQCCAEKATCAAETSESGVAVAAEWEVEAVVVGLETGASGVTTTAERVASGFAAAADWEVEALVVRLETGASGLAAAAEWEVESAVAGIETPLPHASFFLGATVASTLAKADGFSLLHIARHGAAATATPKTVGLDGFCWWEVSGGGGGQFCGDKAAGEGETGASGFSVTADWEVDEVVVGLGTGASGVATAAEMVASGFAAAAG